MLNIGHRGSLTPFPFLFEFIEIASFDLESFLSRNGFEPTRILLITGTRRSRPVAEALMRGVAGIETHLVGGVKNSLACHEQTCAEDASGTTSTLVLGVGDSCVLDFAKYHASERGFDYLAIPTDVSNDGLASGTSFMALENGTHASLPARPPIGVLIDRELLSKSPTSAFKNGLGDLLSNHSAVLDWDLAVRKGRGEPNALARLFSLSAVQSILGGPPLLRDAGFRERYINSILLSGLAKCIGGDDSPCDGSEHLIGDVIMRGNGARYGHGFLVGSIAPYIAWLHDESDRILVPTARLAGFRFAFFDLIRRRRSFASLMDEARQSGGTRFTVLDLYSNAELQVRYFDFLRALRRQAPAATPQQHPASPLT